MQAGQIAERRTAKDRKRFETIHNRYRAVVEREQAYRLAVLLPKYGQCWPPILWLTRDEYLSASRPSHLGAVPARWTVRAGRSIGQPCAAVGSTGRCEQ